MFALMEAVGIVDTHLVDSHRRGSSGVWDEASGRDAKDLVFETLVRDGSPDLS
jgi:hypothetical protein